MGFEECDYVSDIGNCVRGSLKSFLKRDTGIDEAVAMHKQRGEGVV